MLKVALVSVALALAAAPAAAKSAAAPHGACVACFKTGERVSGMNKICYYDCLGSAAAITIASTALCPLSINR